MHTQKKNTNVKTPYESKQIASHQISQTNVVTYNEHLRRSLPNSGWPKTHTSSTIEEPLAAKIE